jgi:Cu/Ag efflux protein CusF
MKKRILLVVVLTLVAFASGAIAAAPPKSETPAPAPAAPAAPVKMEKFNGAVKNVDATAKSITVAKGKVEKNFEVAADTKITKGKEALKFEDLKAGMNVAVEYKKEGEKLVTASIKAAAPKATPKAK